MESRDTPSLKGRVQVRVAREAGHQLLLAIVDADPPLRLSERAVVDGVIGNTVMFCKLEDTVAVRQVAELAGLNRETTARILSKLNERPDVPISYRSGSGRGKCSTISIAAALERSTYSPVEDRPLAGERSTDPPVEGRPLAAVKVDSEAIKVDSEPVKVDRARRESRHTEKILREDPPKARTREESPNPNLCQHGHVDALADPCPDCKRDRAETKARALGGKKLTDVLREAAESS